MHKFENPFEDEQCSVQIGFIELMLFALYVLKLDRIGNFLKGIRGIVVKARSKPERASKAKVWNVNGRNFICFWMRSSEGRARGEETKSVKNRPLGWHCQNWTLPLLWIESNGPKIGDIYCRGRILKVDCFWKVKRSIRSCGTESEAKWPSRIHKLEIFSFVKKPFYETGLCPLSECRAKTILSLAPAANYNGP